MDEKGISVHRERIFKAKTLEELFNGLKDKNSNIQMIEK
jgi:hypothetical protein